ncbi:hypothetical protein M9Y10_024122 [Tritrichomonas musculus]|uniref:Rab-GAP TBC domain-containing protein n=1 Tax=Tritrichomonas musculus TaxID=1915356 RepID=A0ABR2KYY9_9EUKA
MDLFDSISKLKAEVVSLFHRVSTYIPGNGNVSGVLIVAKNDNELVFWWRDYPEPKSYFPTNKEEKAKFAIILRSNNVQKIMINYHPNEAYLLISTIQPANMHQFLFPPESSSQLLNLAQILSLYQNFKQNQSSTNNNKDESSNSLENAVNFIAESYSATESRHHLYEFTIEKGQMSIPIDFSINGLLPQNVVYVKPDLHIISQFKIVADDFIKNPILESELSSFKSLDELKLSVMNRGVDQSIRSIVWPLIFGILPFDKNKSENILKSRVEEYISIRKQWQTLSKIQLKYFSSVRDAFSTIRVDVKRTHIPKQILQLSLNESTDSNIDISETVNDDDDNLISSPWLQRLSSILKTFTMWNLNVRYTQGLNDLVVIFMTVFCRMYENDNDVAEALTFWCFASFVELNSSGLIAENLMMKQSLELPKIMEIIEKFHPACAKWLRMNNVGDLSFLISSFILAYGRSFSHESILRIWEALACVEAPWLFLRYFSASLIILSFPSFQQVPNCSTGKLVSMLDRIFYNQEIGAVIGVSIKMMTSSNANNKDENSSSEKRKKSSSIFKSGGVILFKPITKYNDTYESVEALFE